MPCNIKIEQCDLSWNWVILEMQITWINSFLKLLLLEQLSFDFHLERVLIVFLCVKRAQFGQDPVEERRHVSPKGYKIQKQQAAGPCRVAQLVRTSSQYAKVVGSMPPSIATTSQIFPRSSSFTNSQGVFPLHLFSLNI